MAAQQTHSKRKRRLRIVAISLLSILVLSISYVTASLFIQEAPITIGKVIRNVPYKNNLKLDIYTPTQKVHELSPVLVYIHGGAWIAGAKETFNLNRYNRAAKSLRASGYTIISIEYTLAEQDKSPFPACIEDASDAMDWIFQNADSLNFDINNIGLFGESAGAHIAMMLAFDKTASCHTDQYAYIINIFGPVELKHDLLMRTKSDSSELDNLFSNPVELKGELAQYLMGFPFEADSSLAFELMDLYSPIYYITPNAAPVLTIHGDQDLVVNVGQALMLDSVLRSQNIPHNLHILRGMNHGFIGATDQQMDSVQSWLIDFILDHYRIKRTGSSVQTEN